MKQTKSKSLMMLVNLFGALFFGVSVFAQSDLSLEPIGGAGGGKFSARCNRDQYLTGLQLRTADDVDAIRPVCVNIYGPTEAGPQNTSPLYFGGSGGQERELLCPSNTPVVIGMKVGYEGQKTMIVNNIHLLCGIATAEPQRLPESSSAAFDGPSVRGTSPVLIFGGTYAASAFNHQSCPDGLIALGINGRSGIWLDAVGLICGVPRFSPNPNSVPAKPTVGSIGKVPLGVHAAFIYAITNDNAGSLKWFRHDGVGVGKFDWQGPRVVNTAWGGFRQVFGGGEDKIFAITTQGALMLYQHTGFNTGLGKDDPKGWLPPTQIAAGWTNITHAFSAGNGTIYSIATDGKLRWSKLIVLSSGQTILDGPKEVGRGWSNLRQVFSIGDGIIYAITSDGKLRWFQHRGYLTGAGLETPGAWIGPKEVGSGWDTYKKVFATGKGFIYGIGADGKLWWYHHKGYRDGKTIWDGPEEVGRGWGEVVQVFAQP